MSDILYLLWSGKYSKWWRADSRGYTDDINDAGRYTESEATKRVVRSAQCGTLAQVTSMVAAPDNWTANDERG